MTTTRWKKDDRKDGRSLQERATGQTTGRQGDTEWGLKNEENGRQMVQND